jgi:UDP-N-acetylmuramate dehydrogenase
MTAVFKGFESTVCAGVPLATMTGFHIGGPAEHLVEPRSFEEFARLFRRCVRSGLPVRLLGGGSNILVSDRGVSGVVFRLTRMQHISLSGARVTCEAGVELPRLVQQAEAWGLSGLEPLAGIPGTVGGAVAMNAGGKYGSIASVLRSVTTLTRGGSFRTRAPERLRLSYRHSDLRGEVVLRAEFRLTKVDPAEIDRTRKSVFREKAQTQPLAAWSAGCIFKNPEGRTAGELIELAGLKGERRGHAVVSTKHANFIVNEGGASAHDVKTLIDKIRTTVRKTFGVDLQLEIEEWN